MIKPFDAFAYYNAIKLHFNGNYDAIKYNFRTSVKEKSFWNRRDKYFFAKVANRFNDPKDMINYYVAHFVNGDAWIGDILKHEDVYTNWTNRIDSFGYYFEQDLRFLEDKYESFDTIFAMNDDTYPPIIQEYLSDEISIETIVVFEQMFGIMDRLDYQIVDTIMWPDLRKKIKKYSPFIPMDMKKMKNIAKKVFAS